MHQYGLIRQKIDGRDLFFEHEKAVKLPASFDLRSACPPVYDQGQQGSCTANAGAACRVMLTKVQLLQLSRAYLYYQERVLEDSTSEDSGASIRDICKATNKYGICPEVDMPYNDQDYTTIPTAEDKTDAIPYKISAYKAVTSATAIKTALVSRLQPVLIGMTVYSSMESNAVANSGILPLPKKNEQVMGGHAVLIVGYKDASLLKYFASLFSTASKGYFIVRNSWGAGWGQAGYFMMPYEYFSKYTYDYWLMEK